MSKAKLCLELEISYLPSPIWFVLFFVSFIFHFLMWSVWLCFISLLPSYSVQSIFSLLCLFHYLSNNLNPFGSKKEKLGNGAYYTLSSLQMCAARAIINSVESNSSWTAVDLWNILFQEAKLPVSRQAKMSVDYWIEMSVFCGWSACCNLINCVKWMLFHTSVLPKLTIKITK